MKLKFDEQGHVVVQDGKPVYVHDDGKEVPFDAPQALAKIGSLNAEAKQHREAKDAAEELIIGEFLLPKQTGYGLHVSLNPQKKADIDNLIRDVLKE